MYFRVAFAPNTPSNTLPALSKCNRISDGILYVFGAKRISDIDLLFLFVFRLSTGNYILIDVRCRACQIPLGWRYLKACSIVSQT